MDVWERMPERDEKAYNMMINLCGRLRRLPEAEALFEEMATAHLEPTGITYCSLLNGLATQASWQRACAVLDEMREQPRLAFSTDWGQVHLLTMSACARAGEYAKTRAVFHTYCDIAQPRHQHFNALLVACASTEDSETAEAVFDEMRAAGLAPREIDWNVLIQCHRRDFAACRRVFRSLCAEAGLDPSEETFAALLQAAALSQDRARDTRWVLDELQRRDILGGAGASSPRLLRELRRAGAA